MNAGDRRHLRLIIVVALLVLASFLGILAVAVAGGFWLIILSVLCLLGVVVVDRAMALWPARPGQPETDADADAAPSRAPARRQDQVLLAVALVAILGLLLFALVRLVTVTGSGSNSHPEAVAPPRTGSAAPQSQLPQQQPQQSQQQQSQHYVTAGTDVHLRAAATTASSIVTTMPAFATPLALTCYEQGEVVFSDPYWYRTSYDGLRGYVSELWLDTGAEPARTDVPHC